MRRALTLLIPLTALFVVPATSLVAQEMELTRFRGPAAREFPNQEEWYLWTDDGVRHYVREFGRGDTVVVLHGGFGAEHSYLIDAVAPLAEQYHFVLYDQRGSLRSPAPDSTITLDRLVEDLDELREELRLEELTLLGHSIGATLTYDYLAAHPGRVRGLVLIGPVLPGDSPEAIATLGGDTARVRAATEAWRSAAEARIAEEIAEEGLNRDSLSSKERTYKWRIRFAGFNTYHVERWREVEGGQAFYTSGVIRALRQNEPEGVWAERIRTARRALNEFAGPVRVILGEYDFITDPGGNVWPHVVGRLKDADLVVLEEAGHNAWIDQPEEFRNALNQALEATTR